MSNPLIPIHPCDPKEILEKIVSYRNQKSNYKEPRDDNFTFIFEMVIKIALETREHPEKKSANSTKYKKNKVHTP
jgi:hypothetical protein